MNNEKKAAKEIKDFLMSSSPFLVLKSIALGRELVRTEKGVIKWKDNIKYPSLRNAVTSELFQKDLIEEENLTGRVLMTRMGRTLIKKRLGW